MDKRGYTAGDLLRDRYEILGAIGRGAYGMVYRARDLQRPGALWAIKVIEESHLSDEERAEARELFRREASILKELNHTGIPKIIDFFSIEPCHFMVMEFVDGVTLQDYLKEHSPDEKTLVEWAIRMCDILKYLHGIEPEPLVFRDLKPSNIMLTEKGRLLFIDFGIARHFNRGKNQDTFLMGTPGFSPPEQYGSRQTDKRSDIYSLGATLYHILSGEDLEQFKYAVPPLSTFRPSVSKELEHVIARCLKRDPAKRYQSAGALREALKEAATGTAAPAPARVKSPKPTPRRAASGPGGGRRLPASFILAAAVLFLLFLPFPLRDSYDLKRLTTCRENLGTIAAALDLYAADARGHYPASLDPLTPRYCPSLPRCPSSRSNTYSYMVARSPDAYTLWCSGSTHVPAGVPPDCPQYSSTGAVCSDGR